MAEKTKDDLLYRDEHWLFEELITQGKTEKQVALENGWTLRVVQKWAQGYHLGENGFRKLKTLSDLQRSLVRASILGDGHITPEGIFIVSHCAQQRDYLFWKYNLLKDCCKTAPAYYPGSLKTIRGQLTTASGAYRFNTRKIYQLQDMRSTLSRGEIVRTLTPFELAIWILDDGYRDRWTWDLCLGQPDAELYSAVAEKCQEWQLTYSLRTDERYIRFHNAATRHIDEIILANIPNNLDIVQAKICERG